MQTRNHAVVWIDHLTARIFYVGITGSDEVVLHSHLSTQHLHHKANEIGPGKVEEDKQFLDQVAQALANSGQILILGPGVEKAALNKFLRRHHAAIARGVVKVESSDHPTDAQIVGLAKRYFRLTMGARDGPRD